MNFKSIFGEQKIKKIAYITTSYRTWEGVNFPRRIYSMQFIIIMAIWSAKEG